jgi:hypothetical protein
LLPRADREAAGERVGSDEGSLRRGAQRAGEPRADAAFGQLNQHVNFGSVSESLACAEVLQEACDADVVGLNQRAEPAHSFAARTVRQALEQGPAEPASVTVVDHHDRRLGGLRIFLRADVPCDTQRPASRRVERDDRLMVAVVHLS